MRNKDTSLNERILSYIEKLPYFTFDNLKILDVPAHHLRIALSRLEGRNKVIRLKRGFYISTKFVEKAKTNGTFTSLIEFISTKLYPPSYLSLEYVLYENNILTDVPVNFTLMTRNKTYTVRNNIGVFIYHKIKDNLFCGYRVEKSNGYFYFKAEKAKALFDFLYLRKKMILNRKMAMELRLNLDVFSKGEIRNLENYIEMDGSKRMQEIFSYLF
ncbi:MAG: hypothetical protein ABIL70_03340 [candidate division WOR-3 bacterium]